MTRLAVLAFVALAAAGCPTALPPLPDAGVEDDAGPEATPYTCHVEGACDRGGLGDGAFAGDVYVCANTAAEADRAADPDALCAQTCGTAIVLSCQDSCTRGVDPNVADPCR